jgi:hypothetical protein
VQTGASGYPQQLLHFNILLNNYSIQNSDVVSGLSSGDIPNLIESASNNKLYLFVNQKSAYMYELSTPNLLTATLSQVSFPSGIIAAAAIPDQVDGEDYSNPCQMQPSFYPCHINGKVYSDSITNCIYDIGEQNISNIKVMLYDNSNLKQQAFTDANGNYTFTVDSVSTYYTIIIDTLNIPFHLTCPISNNLSVHISSVDTIQNNQNFGVVKKTVFDVGVQSISHIGCFQPGYPTTVNIFAGDMISFYSNLNSAIGQSGTVKIIKSSLSLYLGASIGALTPLVNGDTLTYTIADFGAFNFTTDFAFDCLTLPSATVEDNICITVIVKSMNPDNNISNDTLKTCFQVVSSFDPNIKEVYPSGETHPNTESLVYTIHFQNTGTASAINIVVIDTLDALHLDLSSIQLIGYSYKPTVQILDGGIAKFTFANINLPDSNANEPASHGYAQFRIKLKKNLPLGTTIHNTAYIYFDFNSPVVTNTTTNILKY